MNTSAAIRAAAPNLSAGEADAWAKVLAAPIAKFGIATPHRLAGFIGQCAVESEGFLELEEDLNYTSPGHIIMVWPDRFPNVAAAKPYVNNPESLGVHVYGGRMGNAPAPSMDGYTYRGGGLMQTTGRADYEKFAVYKGMTTQIAAAYMRTMAGAAEAAAWDWQTSGCNEIADTWDLKALSKHINGGYVGLADRIKACTAALTALQQPVADTADALDNQFNPTA